MSLVRGQNQNPVFDTDAVFGHRYVNSTGPGRFQVTVDGALEWGWAAGPTDVRIDRIFVGSHPRLRYVVNGMVAFYRPGEGDYRFRINLTTSTAAGLQWASGSGSLYVSMALDSSTQMHLDLASSGAVFHFRVAGTTRLVFDSSGVTVLSGGGVAYHRLFSSSLGFFGATPVGQQSVTALTNNSGGTASDTIAAAGASYSQTNENDFRASVATKINQIRAALAAYGLVV
jgi:hypothetical protein